MPPASPRRALRPTDSLDLATDERYGLVHARSGGRIVDVDARIELHGPDELVVGRTPPGHPDTAGTVDRHAAADDDAGCHLLAHDVGQPAGPIEPEPVPASLGGGDRHLGHGEHRL